MIDVKKTLTKILGFIADSKGRQIQDVSDKITLGGAWTQVYKQAWLVDGVVYYSIEAKPSSYQGNYQYTMASIAAGYRPRANCAGQGCTTDGSFSPKSVVSVFAEANGSLKVNASNNTGGYFFVSGFYRV